MSNNVKDFSDKTTDNSWKYKTYNYISWEFEKLLIARPKRMGVPMNTGQAT